VADPEDPELAVLEPPALVADPPPPELLLEPHAASSAALASAAVRPAARRLCGLRFSPSFLVIFGVLSIDFERRAFM